MQQQIEAELEKEHMNLKSAQTGILEKLRQNLDEQFVSEESRLRCICYTLCNVPYCRQTGKQYGKA